MEQTSGDASAKSTLQRRGSTGLRTRNEDQWLERLELNRGRLSELSRRLRETSAAGDRPEVLSAEGTPRDGDASDQAWLLQDGAATEAMLQLLSQNGEQIERALARIEQGTYGSCEDCDSPIPAERLEIRPEATRCVSCQAARDWTG